MTALHIAQGEIHATDIAYPAIDDENLTMVAVVHLTCKCGETYGHEGFHLDSLDTHPLKETVVHAPASHGIIEHTHLHALTSLGYQGIRDESSQGIVLKDIDINMDMVPRRGDVTQQRREEIIAIRQDLHLIIIKGKGETLVDEQVDNRTTEFRQLEVALFDEARHGTAGELIHGTLADHAFTTGVDAQEQIGDDTHYRHEENHHTPCHRLRRLTIIQDYMNNRCYHDNLIDEEYDAVPGHRG